MFGLLYTIRGLGASNGSCRAVALGVSPERAAERSVADDDVDSVFQVVHDAAQNFGQKQCYTFALCLVVDGKHRRAAAGQVLAQRDDGNDARSFAHEPFSLSKVA